MPPDLKVIYIVGEARSGSTMLDILLSNHDDVLGAGELWSFFENDETYTGICSCGMPFQNCNFWRRVRTEYLAAVGDSNLTHIRNMRLHQDRVRWLPLRMLGIRGKDYNSYCHSMQTLYETLAEVGEKSVIIDSTKQVGRAFNLLNCPNLDVYLIHLVRDARGILWSRLRDKQMDPTIYQSKSLWRKTSIFTILSWSVKNLLAIFMGRFAGGRYILVRYEDIVTNPKREVTRIGDMCGLEMQSLVDKLVRREALHPAHQIGGNLRTRSNHRLRLKLDSEWKERLPLFPRILFLLFAGWLARRLGYKDVWIKNTGGSVEPIIPPKPS